jgi:hypothetical protein
VNSPRTADAVTEDIHAERDALARNLAAVRRDVRREIADKRALAKRALPFVGALAALLAAALVARRLLFRTPPAPEQVERFRIGRFSLVERRTI